MALDGVSVACRHGGDLSRARQRFGEGDWQDLSTGISPWAWPVPALPADVWQRLPERGETLASAACRYYGLELQQVLALPGSQFGIARFPWHLRKGRVALPAPGYAEHARAWSAAGHSLVWYENLRELEALVDTHAVDHLVVIHPGNPSAESASADSLTRCLECLPRWGAVLVDEAFVDLNPERSMVPLLCAHERLWILRSVGKFFGLGGLRLGFLLGSPNNVICRALEAELTPWGVSHPAQWIGEKALADTDWQARQRARVIKASRALECCWSTYLDKQPPGVTLGNGGLFVTLRGAAPQLRALHQQLAEQHLWLRLGEKDSTGQGWLRCGLPPDGGKRLAEAL